ncbi:MFS transporter [Clostridium sp. BL-8]|uniref:MFS transporter n=1 Tax=Clostridium sp. BL-8 TaxID=349938 RepID=UPI00098C06C6|nr:MFS transporter [Clostridium sp. BL-8]OOM81397.1 putative MFS-type transporter YcaD [Clostridium sp. BL-8]
MPLKEKMHSLFSNNKWILFVIGLLIGVAMGIINPLSSTHLKSNNVNSLWIGIISSSFFLFMSIGSILVDRKMRNKDIKGTILIGAVISATACGIFPFSSNLVVSLFLMIFMGIGLSFNLVGVQTMLQNLTEESSRSVISGLYSLCFAVGFVLSSVLGPAFYEWNNWVPFIFPICALLICQIVIHATFKEKLLFSPKPKINTLKKISIGLQGGFLYGFTETTLTTLYPVFLIHEQYDLRIAGYALGIFVLGSIIGTMPITYLSDKLGREKVLLMSIIISVFTIAGIMIFDNFVLRLIFSFLSGFIIGPIYPLAMAVSVQNLSKEEIPSGTSLFTSFYGGGSTIGPLLSSAVMSMFGDNYIFSVCLLLFITFPVVMYVKKVRYESESGFDL